MSEAEASVLGIREWLGNAERLPVSVCAYLWEQFERDCRAFLPPDEWNHLLGRRGWDRWDAAIAAHFGKRRELWLAESQEALNSSNAYIDMHGLPLKRS